jgi:hypothetical protein
VKKTMSVVRWKDRTTKKYDLFHKGDLGVMRLYAGQNVPKVDRQQRQRLVTLVGISNSCKNRCEALKCFVGGAAAAAQLLKDWTK